MGSGLQRAAAAARATQKLTPYDKGVRAAKRGKRICDNPYHNATSIQSKHFREWAQGYVDQAHSEADDLKSKL